MNLPIPLTKLICLLKRLPGVGSKSAERFAFQMLNWPQDSLSELGDLIKNIQKELEFCKECGTLIEKIECSFCASPRRNQELLCIIATFKDVFLMESTREYNGIYHVLGGIFSPLQGKTIAPAVIHSLIERIEKNEIQEVILALDPTLEGDATALFLKEELAPCGVKISRPALGLPMGSSLDFVDGGTLARALSGRSSY